MGIDAARLFDQYADRPRVRSTSPGASSWWARFRGALSSIVADARTAVRGDRGFLAVPPGSRRAGEGRSSPPASLPSLYDHTPRSLAALGRVVSDVASVRCSPAHMSCRSSAA